LERSIYLLVPHRERGRSLYSDCFKKFFEIYCKFSDNMYNMKLTTHLLSVRAAPPALTNPPLPCFPPLSQKEKARRPPGFFLFSPPDPSFSPLLILPFLPSWLNGDAIFCSPGIGAIEEGDPGEQSLQASRSALRANWPLLLPSHASKVLKSVMAIKALILVNWHRHHLLLINFPETSEETPLSSE